MVKWYYVGLSHFLPSSSAKKNPKQAKYNENNGDKKRLVSETTDVKQEPDPYFTRYFYEISR